ncbi:MAG TPA: ABC transporter substrate-binding protein [Trueperaceae bacterium]
MKRVVALLTITFFTLAWAQEDQLEIFSWWAGDEGPALEALIDLYEQQYPETEVINATVTGGAGVNARAVLKTRMLGGEPPDSFQVHAGQELIGTWVTADRMEDITFIFEEQGWMEAFPQGLIDLISTDEGIWSVPVNIHRSNVMWFVPSNLEEWGVEAPSSWQEFVDTTCPALQDAGVTPLVVGEPWTQVHLWESVALAELGADGWQSLWDGELAFDDPQVVQTFETFSNVMECANEDAAGLTWQQATDRVVNGQAAFNVMGDWAAGYMTTTLDLTPGEDFGWAASPGTDGTFMLLSDSFGLPVGAPHRENAVEWLTLVGSAEAQNVFNPLKGSISPRLDTEASLYNEYSQSALEDYRNDTLVGSLQHGVVAPETFMSEFPGVIQGLAGGGSPQAAAAAAQELANQVGIGD